MNCPRCGLVNPPTAKRCDCGYDFETKTVEEEARGRTAGQVSISALAAAYRRLVLWFGAQLILNIGAMGARAVFGNSLIGRLIGLAAVTGGLVTIGALAWYGYRTAAALGSGVGWLWALAMFIPCANAITLLVLSSRATQACAAHGIPVGLLGPKVIPSDAAHRE